MDAFLVLDSNILTLGFNHVVGVGGNVPFFVDPFA